MQETDQNRATSNSRHYRRILLGCGVVFALLILALVPPLISVNRLQRRIARSIGDSLGRPVHLDQVTLNLVPLPGFTLENFVVGEDPAFGAEPVIRADTVTARLRIRSLWRRQVEFSNISLTNPSVNLVRNAQGKWNLEGILLQASHVNAAPTDQSRPGPTPRFPYIEATGARLNLKIGDEKMPISLTDAKFALWLSNPDEWRIELEAHPARTDTNANDTGIFKVQGTLKRAASFADVPVALTSEWQKVQLGEASIVVLGSDAGWRGLLNLSTDITGTIGVAKLNTRARLTEFRRADFVPAKPLDLDVQCQALAALTTRSLHNIQCGLPVGDANAIPLRQISLTGDMPDVQHPWTGQLQVGAASVPAAWFFDWARLFSPRLQQAPAPEGVVSGSFTRNAMQWTGSLKSNLTANTSSNAPISLDLSMQMGATPVKRGRNTIPLLKGLVIEPSALHLGKNAQATLTGSFTSLSYTLHLTGSLAPARLMELRQIAPPAVDSLDAIFSPTPAQTQEKLDLACSRNWGGLQTCQTNATASPSRRTKTTYK